MSEIFASEKTKREKPTAGLSLFVVDRDAAGVTVKDYRTIDNLHAADIRFDNAPATLLGKAGFGDVSITPHTFACRFDSADDYWQAFLDLAGGAAESLSRLPDAMQAKLRAAVADDLASHRDGDGYVLDYTVLVATARR